MPDDIGKVDPEWAWAAYEPGGKRPWSRRLAAHLYRRAGFAGTWADLEEAVKVGPAEAVERLFEPPPAGDEFGRSINVLAERTAAAGDPAPLAAWWLYRMVNTPDPLLEKLTLFWHGHFATSAAKVGKAALMLDQNELLRRHSRGKFEVMVRAISRDAAMLLYLDSATNRRIHPNENYARELMELFCLGAGNYTENDIKEAARAFTGWEVLGDRFRFNRPQHDIGSKTFLGRTGDFDGDEAVPIILDQTAAPRFIAHKLIRFFVFEEPAVPMGLIEPIARDLREHDFEIGPVVKRILASNLFFSAQAVGRKVRSPVELSVGLLRALGASTNFVKLAQGVAELGQSLFYPPNVKGWDGGRAWINSATLLGRTNLVQQVLTARETTFEKAGGSLAVAADRAGTKTPRETVDWLLELLVAVELPAETRDALVRLAGDEAGQSDRSLRIGRVIRALSATPEFQLA